MSKKPKLYVSSETSNDIRKGGGCQMEELAAFLGEFDLVIGEQGDQQLLTSLEQFRKMFPSSG